MIIVKADLDDPRVLHLLELHVTRARAETARGSAHALAAVGLRTKDIGLWAVWDQDELLGLGALKAVSKDHGEVKSMYTAEHARRRGVGSAVLAHIIAQAREQGMKRLSLETGSWDYFTAARAFYRRHGFEVCPPFADYKLDPNSVFMTLDLAVTA
ncbi:MAG TPA: GNAT family N-acetyltransferase [Steroidobacteraceae bacterium]|nr:GNAT family N-acetyltransferase [Steroidobacteraceae bacterium]